MLSLSIDQELRKVGKQMSEALPGEGEYWFNIVTGTVESGPQSDWSQLLGPYNSRAEAELAMTKVRERNEQWDAEDEEDDEF